MTRRHIKTTVEISESLLVAARTAAAREGTTVHALIEEGLRYAVERRRRAKRFNLRDASIGGKGLQPGVSLEPWSAVRGVIHHGR